MRRTKIICTIGPGTSKFENLKALAKAGMNIARLNFSHGEYEWHLGVMKAIKRLNEKYGYSIAIMLDTKGSEIRSGDLKNELEVKEGQKFTFTTKNQAEYPEFTTSVNYDGFSKDVKEGDMILVDGGIMNFKVMQVKGKDIICKCIDGGILKSRRHLNIRGKSAKLPSIIEKDWEDIKFGVKNGIDFIALSFVNDAKSIEELRTFLKKGKHPVDIIAKVESTKAVDNIEEIVKAADGVMVARGDLGSELLVEEVPLVQDRIVELCKRNYKPVIVATHLLESMITSPTPTRAEVTDIAVAVKDQADAIMLSGETAVGKYPVKAVEVMSNVANHIEKMVPINKNFIWEATAISKNEITRSAATIATNISAKAIMVFTRSGSMAALLSHYRPNCPIFAFTNTPHVRRQLNLYWGVYSSRIEFSSNPEKTIQRAFELLKNKKMLKKNDSIIVVSDIIVDNKFINTVQVRKVA